MCHTVYNKTVNAIEIKDLKKHFGKVKAVDGLSFEVNQGEIFGFLGPNGAGKTTTIRCMMNFIRPNKGSLNILGKDAQINSVELKNIIGYLTPDQRLYDNLTGKDHIKIIESIRGHCPKAKVLAKRLDANLDARIKTLSTGNKQKISLILALMHDPDLVILDEPTTGLDPLLQNTIYEILVEMKDRGKTIFMSSHNLAEVEKICERAAIIKNGKLIATENIKELHEKRMYLVSARFNNPINVNPVQILENCEAVSVSESEISIKIKGDLNKLIKILSDNNIHDLTIEHAGLDEIFMEFYK